MPEIWGRSAQVDLVMDHGCDFVYAGIFTEPDGVTRVPCGGASLASQMRTDPEGELAATFSFTWTDAARGEFTMKLAKAAVNEVADGYYRYDILFTDAAGTTEQVQEGRIMKKGTITQPS